MVEPWMMLDIGGEPIPASFFDRMERRPVGAEELWLTAQSRGSNRWTDRLRELLGKYQEGDTLFWYTSPAADWEDNVGTEGYALLRGGWLVDDIMVRMN